MYQNYDGRKLQETDSRSFTGMKKNKNQKKIFLFFFLSIQALLMTHVYLC